MPNGATIVSIPGVRVSVAETLIDKAFQQPRFAQSDVHRSRLGDPAPGPTRASGRFEQPGLLDGAGSAVPKSKEDAVDGLPVAATGGPQSAIATGRSQKSPVS